MSDQNSEEALADRMREGNALREQILAVLNGRPFLILYEDAHGGISECSCEVDAEMRELLGGFLINVPIKDAAQVEYERVEIPKHH